MGKPFYARELLIPWIIAEKDRKIVAGHCDCMAGLGGTCSHVASFLWAIECMHGGI
uniref:SWIM-type domain-containing protein n=1 Tax=Amphimedon queenslandica TaxID=400682 RepID=A0A1X7TAX0_AMPQE